MKTIKFEVAPTAPTRTNSGVIRISGEMYDDLSRLSIMTRQPISTIANKLLTEALSAVELVEVPLYTMTVKTEEE
jgi:hypothetical protein